MTLVVAFLKILKKDKTWQNLGMNIWKYDKKVFNFWRYKLLVKLMKQT